MALVGVGWLLSRADSGGAKLDVGVGACEGVVCAEEGGGDSCCSQHEHGMSLSARRITTPFRATKGKPASSAALHFHHLRRIAFAAYLGHG